MINFESNQGRFFEVTAKCGHVGRNKFYKGVFFVRAADGCEAATKTRVIPRVKHHHKDAILSVIEIGYDEFRAGREKSKNDPYFNCNSKQEQDYFMSKIQEGVHDENNDSKFNKRNNVDRQSKLQVMRRYFRKMDKYGYGSIGV